MGQLTGGGIASSQPTHTYCFMDWKRKVQNKMWWFRRGWKRSVRKRWECKMRLKIELRMEVCTMGKRQAQEPTRSTMAKCFLKHRSNLSRISIRQHSHPSTPKVNLLQSRYSAVRYSTRTSHSTSSCKSTSRPISHLSTKYMSWSVHLVYWTVSLLWRFMTNGGHCQGWRCIRNCSVFI